MEATASSSAEEDAASGEEDLANELPERQDSLGPLPASEPKIASSPLTTAPEAAAVGLSTKKRRSFRKSISKRISRRLTGDGQSSLSNKKKRKRKRKKAKKPKPSGWTPRHWEDLQVGELVFLRNNDSVPADIIVLNTSEPDGLCYIETKNLDGETNLKIRNGFPQFSYLDSKQKIQDLHMRIEVEPPNTHLYSFKAAISVAAAQQPQQQSAAGVEYFPTASVSDGSIASPAASKKHSASAIGGLSEKKIPVTINELLLRGCTLRNTDWVIGVVVYTGEDTRLLMNSGETPSKRSMIEISMNIQVFLMLLFLLLLCTAVSIGSYIIAKQATSGQSQAPYLFPSSLAESISQSTFYVFMYA
jgi:phospholipid-translocating ATPase